MTSGSSSRPRGYLARYAEPEARLASLVDSDHFAVLVVPAHREDAAFLDGYLEAAASAPGRVLCIVVANEHDDASAEEAAGSECFLRTLIDRLDRVERVDGASFGQLPAMDVLIVDRVTVGRRVPRSQAVGLARKIGLDLALALFEAGRVGEVAHTTDADASLPEGYFLVRDDDAAGYLHPFAHVTTGDQRVYEATLLHELFLRYWVAGLRSAGSPYAFHTVGSTVAVSLPSYAAVRGVPRRAAGEDFYLLQKLAKVGPIRRLGGDPVRLACRRSARTPFGTGRAVDQLERRALELPAPESFRVLGRVLDAVDALAAAGDVSVFAADIRALGVPAVAERLASARVLSVLGRLCVEARGPAERGVRLGVWLDAFRTMKLIHALRDDGFPDLPWRTATGLAPFVPGDAEDPARVLAALVEAEEAASPLSGPTLARDAARKGR